MGNRGITMKKITRLPVLLPQIIFLLSGVAGVQGVAGRRVLISAVMQRGAR